MRNYISVLVVLIMILVGCGDQGGGTSVNIGDLKSAPATMSLNSKQTKAVEGIHNTFKEVFPISLEQSITNFSKDANPDKEIAVWQKMEAVYTSFAEQHKASSDQSLRKEAFKLILLRSSLGEEEAIKRAKLKLLSQGDIKSILKMYND